MPREEGLPSQMPEHASNPPTPTPVVKAGVPGVPAVPGVRVSPQRCIFSVGLHGNAVDDIPQMSVRSASPGPTQS